FQFHLEMDERLVERWLANPAYRDELAASGLPHDEQAIRAQTRRHIAAMQRPADAVSNNFLHLLRRPRRRHTLPSRESPQKCGRSEFPAGQFHPLQDTGRETSL